MSILLISSFSLSMIVFDDIISELYQKHFYYLSGHLLYQLDDSDFFDYRNRFLFSRSNFCNTFFFYIESKINYLQIYFKLLNKILKLFWWISDLSFFSFEHLKYISIKLWILYKKDLIIESSSSLNKS